MKTIKFTVNPRNGKLWARIDPPCGDPQDVPISDVLRWALEQINFEQWSYMLDDDGCLESMTIGLPEARDAEGLTVEEVAAGVGERLRSVNLSGIFARAREEDIPPDMHDLAEKIRLTATEGGYENAEMHYAFELFSRSHSREHLRVQDTTDCWCGRARGSGYPARGDARLSVQPAALLRLVMPRHCRGRA